MREAQSTTQEDERVLIGFTEGVRDHRGLLFITLLVAACSITYELLIAHALALLAANAVIWYSIVIGCFLLGMGVGSLIADRVWPSTPSPDRETVWKRLIGVELLLSCIGFSAIPILHSAHSLYAYLDYWNYTTAGLILFFGTALGQTLLIGILTGIELPLLIAAGKSASSSKNLTNTVLAFDYFGSLLGAIGFPLLLLPSLSTLLIGTLVASLNLFAALILCYWCAEKHIKRLAYSFGVALTLVFTSTLIFEKQIEQFFLKRFYCYRLLSRSINHYLSSGSEYPDILRVRSSYQMIDLLHDMEGDGTDPFVQGFTTKFTQHPDWPHNRLLFLNGDWQFHSNHEEVYHEWFAHVPIMNTGRTPERVLVLGGGDGLLIRELLRYPGITSITHIDLDEKLIELARSHETFLRLNGGALLNERVHTTIADGMQFVRTSAEKFDAIYIDFPTPTDYDLSKLYSREFYTFVRRRLSENGFMVFDSVSTGALHRPDATGKQALKADNRWLNFYHTLRAAGFTRIVPYNSTLGFNNEQALQMASDTYSQQEAEERVATYVRQRQQGFTMVGLPGTIFGSDYREPPGSPLFALNKERYESSFKTQYPQEDEIDYSKVNSIFRPRLAIMPVWNARLPF